MTNPSTPTPEAGWIEWKGGECPVGITEVVEARFRSGGIVCTVALGLDWKYHGDGADLVAYRLYDRLTDERSAREDIKPSDDAVAGAIERLEEWAARVERDGGWSMIDHLRTLIADHARLAKWSEEAAAQLREGADLVGKQRELSDALEARVKALEGGLREIERNKNASTDQVAVMKGIARRLLGSEGRDDG